MQNFYILRVWAFAREAGHFQEPRDFSEMRCGGERAETGDADIARADIFMSVVVRVGWGFTVVGMHRQNARPADGLRNFFR